MCKADGVTSKLMDMLRAEADRLIVKRHPLALEAAEDHGYNLDDCEDQFWFRTALADKLRIIEAKKRSFAKEEEESNR